MISRILSEKTPRVHRIPVLFLGREIGWAYRTLFDTGRYALGDAGEDRAYVRRYLWCDSQLCTGFPKGSTSHLLTGVQPQ